MNKADSVPKLTQRITTSQHSIPLAKAAFDFFGAERIGSEPANWSDSTSRRSTNPSDAALLGERVTIRNRFVLIRVLVPALGVGIGTAGVTLAMSGLTGPAAWIVETAGITTACVGLVLAWKAGSDLQRSFDEVADAVRVAALRLSGEPPEEATGTRAVVGQLTGLVEGIDRLLEDRRQREREVMRADQLAMVGQIAAGVAHELRNPLTSVKMLVQTNLREATRLGFPSEDLEIIEQEIRRMERTLQRFLDFARPPKPERRPVSLDALVDQTFALVEGRARRQGVSLRFARPPVPLVAEADEDQIRQLLVNLVLNALDAMPDGGEIEVRLEEHGDDYSELMVLDTGPGIPDSLFPTLFDPFVSTKETGIGLGLAVSHRIASGNGGELSAVNRPEGGACFVLRLPSSRLVATS
jgi:signal transduction histidine kinase